MTCHLRCLPWNSSSSSRKIQHYRLTISDGDLLHRLTGNLLLISFLSSNGRSWHILMSTDYSSPVSLSLSLSYFPFKHFKSKQIKAATQRLKFPFFCALPCLSTKSFQRAAVPLTAVLLYLFYFLVLFCFHSELAAQLLVFFNSPLPPKKRFFFLFFGLQQKPRYRAYNYQI